MASNTTPIFPLTPYIAGCSVTGTTTDKSGATTTNIVTLLTAQSNHTKVTRIRYKFVGTSTAGTALVWITDTNGTTIYACLEQTYAAITSSTTVASAEGEFVLNDYQLKSGQLIRVGNTTVNTNCHWTAQQ